MFECRSCKYEKGGYCTYNKDKKHKLGKAELDGSTRFFPYFCGVVINESKSFKTRTR